MGRDNGTWFETKIYVRGRKRPYIIQENKILLFTLFINIQYE